MLTNTAVINAFVYFTSPAHKMYITVINLVLIPSQLRTTNVLQSCCNLAGVIEDLNSPCESCISSTASEICNTSIFLLRCDMRFTHCPLRVRINIPCGDVRMRALIEPSVYRDARAALKMESVSVLAALVEEERARFPSGAPGKFVYGTAGFRDK